MVAALGGTWWKSPDREGIEDSYRLLYLGQWYSFASQKKLPSREGPQMAWLLVDISGR